MLTPVDIENKEFKKIMRGYDPYEVEGFIKDVVSDYEKLYRENANMKEKIEMLTTSLTNYRSMEETMQSAMIVAQTTADDIKKAAIDKADNIVREAELKAQTTISNSEKEIVDLRAKYISLQSEIESFKNRIKALLLTYDKLLDDFPKINVEKSEDEAKNIEIKPAIPSVEPAAQPAHATTENDIYEELKKVAKRENKSENMMPENPRIEKQNALLSDILTEKEEKKPEREAFSSQEAEGGNVREVVINLTDKSGDKSSYYDVFSDTSL